jgi:hypothetical protein
MADSTEPDNSDTDDERPCLHCLIGDLIDEFYGEYGSPTGEPDTVDADEIMMALAKTVAEITYDADAVQRQSLIEEMMREIAKCEAEFRERSTREGPTSAARH